MFLVVISHYNSIIFLETGSYRVDHFLMIEVDVLMQGRLVKGEAFVHETFGAYRTLEELWDGEI